MKKNGRFVGFAAAMLIAVVAASAAPIVGNAGFEDPPYPPPPGYGDIPVWTDNTAGNGAPEGVNPDNVGGAPFLNGLTPPEGTHVAFIQRAGTISQNLAGFVPGREYQVIYYQNERGSGGAGSAAERSVDLGGVNVSSPIEVTRSTGGIDQFRRVVSRPVTATAASLLLEMHNLGGWLDNTLLLDAVSIRQVTPLTLLFQDNFDVDNTDYGNSPEVHVSEYDVNFGLATRQAGLYATRTYSETAHSSGGPKPNFTQVDNHDPATGAVLQDGLLIASDTGDRFTAVSPNQNFNQNVFNRLMIEFDVNPYIAGPAGDAWAAVRFLDDSQNVGPSDAGVGFGILFRDTGGFQAFDGNASIAIGGPIWPASETGWHTILIDVALATLDGVTPVTVTAYADGVQFLNYTTLSGFTDNYVTLSGYYGGSDAGSLVHGFDNLNIYAQIPEPGTLALLCLGLAALARRRRKEARTA